MFLEPMRSSVAGCREPWAGEGGTGNVCRGGGARAGGGALGQAQEGTLVEAGFRRSLRGALGCTTWGREKAEDVL